VELLLRNGTEVNREGGAYGHALPAASCGGQKKVVVVVVVAVALLHAQRRCRRQDERWTLSRCMAGVASIHTDTVKVVFVCQM
jgi:hypothetical protein